jgi:hypothetical protein
LPDEDRKFQLLAGGCISIEEQEMCNDLHVADFATLKIVTAITNLRYAA